MNYGELKTYLTTLINRKDVPNALAGQFINQAINRLTKTVRPPFLQTVLTYAPSASTLSVAIPTDFIELINLYTDQVELEQVDMGGYLRRKLTGDAGTPTCFVKIAGEFLLFPALDTDTDLNLHYYRATAALVANTDENGWTTAATDAVVYGAAELAADFYEDDRVERFASKYNTCLVELQNQIYEDQFSGPMAVQSAYQYGNY